MAGSRSLALWLAYGAWLIEWTTELGDCMCSEHGRLVATAPNTGQLASSQQESGASWQTATRRQLQWRTVPGQETLTLLWCREVSWQNAYFAVLQGGQRGARIGQ